MTPKFHHILCNLDKNDLRALIREASSRITSINREWSHGMRTQKDLVKAALAVIFHLPSISLGITKLYNSSSFSSDVNEVMKAYRVVKVSNSYYFNLSVDQVVQIILPILEKRHELVSRFELIMNYPYTNKGSENDDSQKQSQNG